MEERSRKLERENRKRKKLKEKPEKRNNKRKDWMVRNINKNQKK